MKNFEKKFHIKNKTDYFDLDIKNSAEIILDQQFEIGKSNSVSLESMLGPDSLEIVRGVFEILKETLKERGIDNPVFSSIFFKQEGPKEEIGGISFPTHIEIFNRPIENQGLKQIELVRTIIHELYHSIGKQSFVVTEIVENGEPGLIMDSALSGASFKGKSSFSNEHANLLEEVAAVHFELDVFKESKKLFSSESIASYDAIILDNKRALESQFALRKKSEAEIIEMITGLFPKNRTPEQDKAIQESPVEIELKYQALEKQTEYMGISRQSDSEKVIFYQNPASGASMLIFERLISAIPDFKKLLENARVHGKLLPLARAIDGVFGSGWYRKITTAKVVEADKLLIELSKIKVNFVL